MDSIKTKINAYAFKGWIIYRDSMLALIGIFLILIGILNIDAPSQPIISTQVESVAADKGPLKKEDAVEEVKINKEVFREDDFVKTVFTLNPIEGKSDLSSPWSPWIKLKKINSYQIEVFKELMKYEKDYPGISRLGYFEDTFGLTSSRVGDRVISFKSPSKKQMNANGCTQFIWSTGKKYSLIYKSKNGLWYDKRYSIKDCVLAGVNYYIKNREMFKKHKITHIPILSYVCHQQGDGGCVRIVKVVQGKVKKLNYNFCSARNTAGKCTKSKLVNLRSNMLRNVGALAKRNMLQQCGYHKGIKNKRGKTYRWVTSKCNDRMFAQIYYDYWSIASWREAGFAVQLMKSKISNIEMAKL